MSGSAWHLVELRGDREWQREGETLARALLLSVLGQPDSPPPLTRTDMWAEWPKGPQPRLLRPAGQ